MNCSTPASLSFTNSQSLLKLMSIESAMQSNFLILCCPLLLFPSIFPSIRVFSSELALCIRWSKYWSFNFSIRYARKTVSLWLWICLWQSYLKKQEKSQINNLTQHLKKLEKEEMKNPRVSRRKEILKIRTEINAKETKETIAKINKTKSCFFKKGKQNWQTISQTHQERKEEEPYYQNWKWKWENHKRQHWNTKDHKRLLPAAICQ